MDVIDDRFAVYTTVLFVCSAIGALAGFTAGFVTLALVVACIEGAYWLGGVLTASPDRLEV